MLISGLANGAGFMVTDNTALAVSALVGTVALTLAVVKYIDKRIAEAIKPISEQVEELRASLLGVDRRPPDKRR